MDEQNIPIDINTGKLLDWLISRRHVSKDWQPNVLAIREKINSAIQDMPEHEEIVELLSGQHINYFHCLKIIEILKETEADTKNLFGRYGSQRMKDWQNVVSLYQRDGVYLAEAAQMLIRNVNFEVPSLRKQVAKFEQVQVDAEKKIKDYTKTETATYNEFNTICKQLGISGKNIKNELVELLKELPGIYEKATKKIKMVESSVNLYGAFLKYHSGDNADHNALCILKYVIDNGNTTTYEYTYGEKPVLIEEIEINISEAEDKCVDEGGIDFGDDIDFGDNNFDNIVVEEGQIDWGNLNTDEGFEIVEHADLNINLEESGIVVEKSGMDGGVARGTDAYTVLDNPKTRHFCLNDLFDLQAFLAARLYEMSNDSDLLSVSQMQDAPAILQMQTSESIQSMIDCVNIGIDELSNKRTQHLHNIKHSPKYVDMLTASLNQKLAVVDRLKASKKVLEGQIQVARNQIKDAQPVISRVIQNTKILQKQIEEDISKKYKGRPVHIVGAVNML
ncbi:hypothetical protein ILUMI_23588 [Ignelater luminosus]|uniref:CDK5 regulatory subunit-associated protein 3 n=1 Tax=Ignelater luminosus TaxID=2038154 RepID=A0A8K0G1G5_IGNLU|nr:hypothetical protein ILUMI_23588 [Ignelater luminosus]